ncbi:MAG: HDIG domain-containing protein [Paludibacter sp.]|nr:HDIG domain-containing protein [Paludibacter sp.]MDD4198507.1 HDIG domain-containing protein [Paludibacter sp.]MDD4427582.1 HDIG domain-containing protein [Paludibacter sp.]
MFDPYQIIQKYYMPGTKLYYVLVKHSEQVRDKALEVAMKHPELNANIDFIAEAAMLHDIGIYLCNAPRIFCQGIHQYIEHGYLGAEILCKEGLQQHALVCERHTGTGISLKKILENNLPLPKRNMVPVSIEEQIICYADKFFSKTALDSMHDPDKIRLMIGKHGVENITIFNGWHARFS